MALGGTLRILLADDHALVRAGFRAMLEAMEAVSVVGEAIDGLEALRLMRELDPEIAIFDISMPGLNGLEATVRAAKEYPRTRVIILSMHSDEQYVRRAFLVGAAGYLLKSADRSELEMAVRAVARGDMWISPQLARSVVGANGDPKPFAGPMELLTPRQREVLQLIAEGFSSKDIANRLDVGVKTVENHRSQLMERLDVHGVAGLVRYAIRSGIVEP